jgi:hypothetical protein
LRRELAKLKNLCNFQDLIKESLGNDFVEAAFPDSFRGFFTEVLCKDPNWGEYNEGKHPTSQQKHSLTVA